MCDFGFSNDGYGRLWKTAVTNVKRASYEPPVLKQETHIFTGRGSNILSAESERRLRCQNQSLTDPQPAKQHLLLFLFLSHTLK